MPEETNQAIAKAIVEQLEATGSCELIAVDRQELKLLRSIAVGVAADEADPDQIERDLEALKPWSDHYPANPL